MCVCVYNFTPSDALENVCIYTSIHIANNREFNGKSQNPIRSNGKKRKKKHFDLLIAVLLLGLHYTRIYI